MLHRTTATRRIASLIALLALGATSCDRSSRPSAEPPPQSALPAAERDGTRGLQVDQAPFRFDSASVTELLITKSDAASGDRWSARLEREDNDGGWVIRTGPGGKDLADKAADGRFVLHLLDTLRTLQVTAPAPGGPLAGLGLEPPRFALKWKTRDAAFELLVGMAEGSGQGGAYVSIPDASGEARAVVVNGATLRMLDYLASFDILRQRTLSTLASDDVEELEIKRGGKPLFYAQREGDDWTGRSHRRYRGDVGSLLDGLTHARILAFCDDASESKRVRPALERAPDYEAVLKGRLGRASTIRLHWDPRGRRELWAEVSTRPGAVFRVYPELSRFFENVPK